MSNLLKLRLLLSGSSLYAQAANGAAAQEAPAGALGRLAAQLAWLRFFLRWTAGRSGSNNLVIAGREQENWARTINRSSCETASCKLVLAL